MFQYAFIHAMAMKRRCEFLLDVDAIAFARQHNGYELKDVFSIEDSLVADPATLRELLGWRYPLSIRNVLRHRMARPFRSDKIYVEKNLRYQADLEEFDARYWIGYWQSERYFSHVGAEIRRAFRFSNSLSEATAVYMEQIRKGSAVSVHFRRGDYVSNSKTSAIHGVCDLGYYRRAVTYFLERYTNLTFFVFSDDLNWVKANAGEIFGKRVVFVEGSHGRNSFRDMQLMSACDLHVIANSTFSWWAAWLAESSRKCVIAPRRWFNEVEKSHDLIPASWISL